MRCGLKKGEMHLRVYGMHASFRNTMDNDPTNVIYHPFRAWSCQ